MQSSNFKNDKFCIKSSINTNFWTLSKNVTITKTIDVSIIWKISFIIKIVNRKFFKIQNVIVTAMTNIVFVSLQMYYWQARYQHLSKIFWSLRILRIHWCFELLSSIMIDMLSYFIHFVNCFVFRIMLICIIVFQLCSNSSSNVRFFVEYRRKIFESLKNLIFLTIKLINENAFKFVFCFRLVMN